MRYAPELNVFYRNAAEEFTQRVGASVGDQVHSIVLFGSVARKRATKESDIDVLVIGSNNEPKKEVLNIGYEVGERSDFAAFITVVYFTYQEFQGLVQLGSPFIGNVLREGVILCDDGTVASLRPRLFASR